MKKESLEQARQALASKDLMNEKRISELSGGEARLRMNKRHILRCDDEITAEKNRGAVGAR